MCKVLFTKNKFNTWLQHNHFFPSQYTIPQHQNHQFSSLSSNWYFQHIKESTINNNTKFICWISSYKFTSNISNTAKENISHPRRQTHYVSPNTEIYGSCKRSNSAENKKSLNTEESPRVTKPSTLASKIQERSYEPKNVKFQNTNDRMYPLRLQDTVSGTNYRLAAQHIATKK